MNTTVNQIQSTAWASGEGFLGLIIRLYDNPFVAKLISVIIAIAVAVLLLSLSKFVAVFIKNKITKNFVVTQGTDVQKAWELIGDVIFYAMAMFSLFIAFNIVGINMGLLMGGISIGVGFAFRQTLSNMISGIMIFWTKEYQLGSIVEFSMMGKIFGRIEEINMSHVIVRTFDLRRHVIPNSSFLKKPIKTYSAETLLKLEFDVVLDANIDINKALQSTYNQVNTYPFVLNKEYTQVLVDSFTDKSIKLSIVFCFDPNIGYSTEVMKSLIQTALIDIYKNLMPKKSTDPKPEIKAAITPIQTPNPVNIQIPSHQTSKPEEIVISMKTPTP